MLRLLAPLLGGLASGSLKSAVIQTKTQALYWAVIVLAAVVALGFLCLFAYLWLVTFLSPIWAAGILFLVFTAVALIAWIASRISYIRQKRILEKKAADERAALLLTSVLTAIPAIAGRKNLLMMAVPLVGLAAFMLSGTKRSADTDDDA